MSEPDPTASCWICGGAYSEHFDAEGNTKTQHVFAEEGGSLRTHADDAKARAEQQPIAATRVVAPPMQYLGNAGQAAGRLVELLLEKGLLSPEEAIYIAGFGPKPMSTPSGYADPASGDPARY